jgi:hypothetical protein
MFTHSVWAVLGVGVVCARAWVCLWVMVLACVCSVGGGVSGAWGCGGVGVRDVCLWSVRVCAMSGPWDRILCV